MRQGSLAMSRLRRSFRAGTRWSGQPESSYGASGALQGLLLDARWREGFSALAALDLSFDAWMYHTQLDDLADLARAFPDTRIVLNHVGGPVMIGPYAEARDEAFALDPAAVIIGAPTPAHAALVRRSIAYTI